MQRNRFITKNQPRAFTLIEILIVIAIIAILMSIAAIGIGNLSAGKGTSTAIATTESLFDEARSIAVSKRCKARVMIDIDDPTDDRYLRRVVIAHERIDDTGNAVANEWVLASRGYNMPQGTYFSKEYSKLKDGYPIPIEPNLTGTNISADFQGKYAYYEFNAEGIFLQSGASFIIGTGIRPKGEEFPKVTKAAQKDFAGFTIWRNGRTSIFRTLDQMGIPDVPTTF